MTEMDDDRFSILASYKKGEWRVSPSDVLPLLCLLTGYCYWDGCVVPDNRPEEWLD